MPPSSPPPVPCPVGPISYSQSKCSFASRVQFTCRENGAALSMTDPIACDSFTQGLLQASRQGPFQWACFCGFTETKLCGLQRTSRSFEKQTSLHPDCGSQVLSLQALVRDHFSGWKNHRLFLSSACQSHHTCGLWMTLVCRMTGECGLGLGGLSTRSEGGRPC